MDTGTYHSFLEVYGKLREMEIKLDKMLELLSKQKEIRTTLVELPRIGSDGAYDNDNLSDK